MVVVSAPPQPPSSSRRARVPVAVLALLAVVAALVAGAALVVSRSDGGQIVGSGVSATDRRVTPAFSAVDLAGSNRVLVKVGRPWSVEVRGDDNLLSRVSTSVRSGVLVIDTRGSIRTRTAMTVVVTAPRVTAVTLSGSGTIAVDGVRSDRLTVGLLGSGTVTASGASHVLAVRLTGSGDVDLGRLSARDATAELAGSGRVVVHATRSLHATVSGTGSVLYSGRPQEVTREVTGTGSITGA